MKSSYLIFILHATIWIFYISLNYALAYFQGLDNIYVTDYLTKYILVIPVFYVNAYYLLPVYAKKNKIPQFILGQVLLLGFHFILFVFAYKYVLPGLFHYPSMPYPLQKVFPRSFWWYSSFFLYAFGFWYANQAIKKQKMINDLQNRNFMMEFNFLKSQINSHFLHNTLNTLFGQALPYSEALANNIMKLSLMMRYSLENIDVEGKVQLQRELEHLQNFIDIHQLRFSNTLQIDYRIEGDPGNHMIPPLSIITIIENAFKYGDLKNAGTPLQIKLDLAPGSIHFFCKNKKKRGHIGASHKIGLENVQKRLDYAFPDKYEMSVKNDSEFYTFELTIKD